MVYFLLFEEGVVIDDVGVGLFPCKKLVELARPTGLNHLSLHIHFNGLGPLVRSLFFDSLAHAFEIGRFNNAIELPQ